MTTDINIINQGTIVLFRPVSPEAQAFFDENVGSEDWQWIGGALAVEHRYAHALYEGLVSDGFSVGADDQ